jgi:ketosteroid isomerase-like protein
MLATTIALSAVMLAAPQVATAPEGAAEAAVSVLLEDLRKAELLLAADEMAPMVAQSLTVVEGANRIAGAFAYLEPMRRLRARKGRVSELRFDEVTVRVYGASAVATYRFAKKWTDGGVQKQSAGWSSDVFERREDGAWLLVHRHRGN